MTARPAAARRLVLSGPEWVRLCRAAGATPPAGFSPTEDLAEPELLAAGEALTRRGVLPDGDRLHPSVAANLAVWAAPVALVRAELAVGGRGLRAAYMVGGPFGSSLFTLDGGGVELSMFPAAALGRELTRCVPHLADREGTAVDAGIHAALGATATSAAGLRGRLPLPALADYGLLSDSATGRLAVTGTDMTLAAELNLQTIGLLQVLTVGRKRAVAGAAGTALVGEVIWLLTATGWVGLRPQPDGTGRQLVDIIPVVRNDIGGWLGPYLARILEGAGE